MSLDLVSLARASSVVPQSTDSPAEAADLLWRDGASVLTGRAVDEASAASIAEVVLGERLLGAGRPIAVTDGGGMDPRRHTQRSMMALHTDGFAYGDGAPDVFFLVCATPSASDGHSFLVDQAALIEALASDQDGRELAEFLIGHRVDQTEEGGNSAIGPVALPLPSGHRAIRRSPDVRPTSDDPDPAYSARMLSLWDGILDAVGALASRFAVDRGEALAIDNTRLAHGRDAYTDSARLLWRCWAWTDRSGSIPSGELWSDMRMLLPAGLPTP